MDFILDNIKLIVFAVLGILYWIGNRDGEKAPGKPTQQGGQPDANEAKRIADIQAEIRRKIAERSGNPVQPQPARQEQTVAVKQRPVQSSKTANAFQQPIQKSVKPSSSREPSFDRASYQRDIDQKMRQVKELEARAAKSKRRPARRKPQPSYIAPIPKAGTMSFRKQMRRELHSHEGMKKAFMLKEILGEPVGEKGPIA